MQILTLTQSADFERVLRQRPQAQSPHFAVHHLSDRPSLTARALKHALRPKEAPLDRLSTDDAPVDHKVVDMSWLGLVVPKRHARRAVTRTLLKRQIRHAMARHGAALRPGLWVVRLRGPFDRAAFPSAASQALRVAARTELDALFDRVRA